MENDERLKSFLEEHWFKSGILIIGIFIAWILYNTFVVQPQQSLDMEAQRIAEEKEEEQNRKDNLATCLEESEYQRQTSHLAICGDPNVGYSKKACFDVFSGQSSYFGVLLSYRETFPDSMLTASSDSDETERAAIIAKNSDILQSFWDECNCGLEKYRRDELDLKKEKRDEICFQKYGE